MKYFSLWLNLGWLSLGGLGFYACTSAHAKTPETVTVDFFKALEEKDFDKAVELATPETRPLLVKVREEAEKQEQAEGKPAEIKVEVVEQDVKANEGTVTINLKIGERQSQEKINLLLVENDWRVVVPAKKLTVLQLVILHREEVEVEVKEKSKKEHPVFKEHPGRGHAYGHDKRKKKEKKRKEDREDDDDVRVEIRVKK